MKNYMVATMYIAKGSIQSTPLRQNLITKVFTESDLVGVDEIMPMLFWSKYFLEA